MKRLVTIFGICFALVTVLVVGVFLFQMFEVSKAKELTTVDTRLPSYETANGKPGQGFGAPVASGKTQTQSITAMVNELNATLDDDGAKDLGSISKDAASL